MAVEAVSGDTLRSPEILGELNAVGILDGGAQYIDLIKKACERLGHHADVLPIDTPVEFLEANYGAVVISGGPRNVYEEGAPRTDPRLAESQLPELGICYGMHEMAARDGGRVERGATRQEGRIKTKVDVTHPLFYHTKDKHTALFTHGNFVTELPEGYTPIGEHNLPDGTHVYSAIAKGTKVAVQFHPEAFEDTPNGYQIFSNFLHGIAGMDPDPELIELKTQRFVEQTRDKIREQVGDKHVIAFVSGGVDSSVAAALAIDVIDPEKFHAYYIDNGFMRDEDDHAIELLSHLGTDVEKIDAQDYFTTALLGITSSVEKREIIGSCFVDIKDQILEGLDLSLEEAMLLQGTNAADRIESGFSKGGSETVPIKPHHNQVKEIKDLEDLDLLLEPLNELFKDEIRETGRYLGVPDDVVDRHPFPGPGTAIRILCNDGHEYEDGDTKTEREIQNWLTFNGYLGTQARLLPVRSVGVGGDERSYIAAVALESDESWERLSEIAARLPAEFGTHINRVVVSLDRRLEELSVTPTLLEEGPINQLRLADSIVFEEMRAHGLVEQISQMPVILLPLSFHNPGERSIVLRPFWSVNFMQGTAMVPNKHIPASFIEILGQRLATEVPGVSQVFIDLTDKPPGTTEWE